MKSWIVVLSMGLSAMGCAVGADEPVTQLPEPAPTTATPPATTTFSGDLKQPTELPKDKIDPADIGPHAYDLGAPPVVPLPGR